jgi:diacylglycerol kinase (ATP)
MPKEKLVILFNPAAGAGRASRNKERLEAELRRQGVSYALTVTESEADLRESTRRLAATERVIAGAGGDSTFLIMAEEILKSGRRTALGMMGMGSSNDIPASFGSDSLEAACRALAEGRPQKIDIGAVEGEGQRLGYFLGQANIGLGAAVNRYVARLAGRHPRLASRQLLAGFLGVREAYRQRRVPISMRIDGGEAGRAEGSFIAAVFANTPLWATGLRIAPAAKADDGQLDLCLVRACPFRRLLRIYSLARKGHHLARPEVSLRRANKFEVQLEGPAVIQTDGEILKVGKDLGPQTITLRVLPAALDILLP